MIGRRHARDAPRGAGIAPTLHARSLVNKITMLAAVHELGNPRRLQAMRFTGLAVAAVVTMVAACGGGDKTGKTDTGTAAAGGAAPPAPAPGAPAAGGAAAAPATGTVHEVKMLGDDKGYRFDPMDI